MNQKVLRVMLVAGWAIFPVISTIHAAEAAEVGATKDTVGEPFAPDPGVSLRLPFHPSDNLSLGAVTESSGEEESASELNRKLTNPVSSIWSISNQFNNFELNNGQWNNNWNFQPVMPVSLTKDLNLITRPVMPFYNIVPHETSPGEFARDAGLGDLAPGGAAVALELGQLGPRRRADSDLSDCYLAFHRSGQVAAWAHSGGRLPHQAVLHRRIPSAMVVCRRRARPA